VSGFTHQPNPIDSRKIPSRAAAAAKQSGNAVALLLFLIGTYLPTSLDGVQYTKEQYYIAAGIAAAIFSGILIINRGRILAFGGFFSCALVTVLGTFTLLSPSSQFAYGAALPYLLLCFLYLLDLRQLRVGRTTHIVFICANVVNFALGVSILLEIDWVRNIIVSYYSYWEPELVVSMLASHKPILTFASHSTASFYMFAFFWINYHAYRQLKRRTNLILAILNLVLLISMNSVTSYAYFCVAVMTVLGFYVSVKRVALAAFLAVACLLLMLYLKSNSVEDLMDALIVTLNSDVNGLSGRYSQVGLLKPNIDYMMANPTRPVGLGLVHNATTYGDSGIIDSLLKGSVFMLIAVYGGLLNFILRNVRRKVTGWQLFLFFLLFEIGFTNLLYFRTIYLLPFFVVYLNAIDDLARPNRVVYSHSIR
jgi:hypothetical protein